MLSWILEKTIGSSNSRLLKKMQPMVIKINAFAEEYKNLSEEQLKNKTNEFKERLTAGETLDELLPEAFAVVKDACRRLCGTEFDLNGNAVIWDMIPYDVQLLGGMSLHKGGIAEMATGEGKTLVATLPLYLNALSGKNCQLVTVNDYLALRDSQWMGTVFKYLGLTVGCIQNSMPPSVRREMYQCDITYGTNSEFGFDYLRDMGMATTKDELVQRDYFFVIIDEVDSILIDEARTPLIISGPTSVSTHRYDKLKPSIAELYKLQAKLCSRLIKEAKEVFENDDATAEELDDAILKVCKVKLAMPKHKQYMRLMEDHKIRKMAEKKEMEIHSDNNRGMLQRVKDTLYFAIDERGGEADLSEKGRQKLSPNDLDAFVMPDITSKFSEIDGDESLTDLEKTEKRSKVQEEFDIQAETIHNISQLLRAYCLFEKDIQYVVQDGKVMIVDENTGRLMPGRRFSEGLHQALEAKEGVTIERETQTLATITIQNYFRLYDKLAGMTGTAETEATEFKEIYKLNTVVIPTNKPCIRIDQEDSIYKTKREKYNAIINEIERIHKTGQPILLGTVNVEVSEILSRLMKRRNIPHNVLNAKNHLYEAEIVSRAGLRGAITVATNMAGRGTDIKLGPGVKELGGLCVIGSARHDSRRIDRQLRGRCSRQGDAGTSRFYVSFEDDLMRLFGSERVTKLLGKFGLEDGEEISAGLLSRTIQGAQKRVEQQNYAIRKNTLEYDDVMNKQRKVIYGLRKNILLTESPRDMLFDFVFTAVAEQIELINSQRDMNEKFDVDALKNWLYRTFPITFTDEDLQIDNNLDVVAHRIVDKIDEIYTIKEKHEGEDASRWLEQHIMLSAIDKLYQEHLYAMDALRSSVRLRSYGQRDPLVEYKQESFKIFTELVSEINEQVCINMFRSAINTNSFDAVFAAQQEVHTSIDQFGVTSSTGGEDEEENVAPIVVTIRREMPKIGRNDPCPCGSGKKFKKCCG